MKWENLKPIVVLTVICLVVSAALAGTYNLTKPVIDAAKAAQANEALAAVLPEGADFEEVTVTAENVRTNEDRVAYLAQFGWEVSAEPVQTQEVRIPTDPSDVFERYNDLQIAQGFDLHDYAGKTVRRYVYEVENYPNGDGQYYATLLICKGTVIGGDVCAAEKGGVMHGFAMPEGAKAAA